ncbi:MAG: alpha/beta hydrolase [Acidobacteria bacterium]|nr:alpha/beta hydrolase [Acidobacteriota bacterium]
MMKIKNQRILISILLSIVASGATAFSQSPAPESKQVEIYGQKIHYLEAGSGPNVILLHGLGGDSSSWAQTIPALASKYHVYVPDQIGFGKSDKPILNYRVATLVDFLAGFFKKSGIEKATLVGNSLGGWAAAAFTCLHPEKVEKLVLVSAAGYTPKRWGGKEFTDDLYSTLNPATAADLKQLYGMIFYNKTFLNDQFIEMSFANKLKRSDANTINAFIASFLRSEDSLDERVKKIKAPTLLIWGREDELTPLAIAEAFAQDIAGSKKVIIDKCGHIPQLEKAADFNLALLKFLNGDAAVSTSAK